ncbi:hypothetical protein [Xanthobacter sediminis]|uniref:hypothetical protein n=1 Tax=Xanthobacter sediminis TaxID=3119926 RepID=UPI00372C378B
MKETQPAAGPAPLPARPVSGVHRGYDTMEFAPQECARDFPRPAARRVRVRVADEEQALLRRVAVEFSANNVVREAADADASEPLLRDASSRMYRD